MLCAFLLLFYFYGDKIILVIIKAQKLPRTQVEDYELYKGKVENMACLMGLVRVEIYRAKALPPDIYVLKGAGNSSCIVMGGNAFEHLSEKEISALISFSILKIKKLNLRFIQGCNILFLLVHLPTIFMKKIKLLKFVGLIMNFFLLPLQAFKRFTFKGNSRYLKSFIKVLGTGDMESVIQTTLVKLEHISSRYPGDAPKVLLADLAMVERR